MNAEDAERYDGFAAMLFSTAYPIRSVKLRLARLCDGPPTVLRISAAMISAPSEPMELPDRARARGRLGGKRRYLIRHRECDDGATTRERTRGRARRQRSAGVAQRHPLRIFDPSQQLACEVGSSVTFEAR